MEDWITQLADAMNRVDDNSHTGCAPDYERLIQDAVADLARQAEECGYAWFHETAAGRELITCNLAPSHEGKHVRLGD